MHTCTVSQPGPIHLHPLVLEPELSTTASVEQTCFNNHHICSVCWRHSLPPPSAPHLQLCNSSIFHHSQGKNPTVYHPSQDYDASIWHFLVHFCAFCCLSFYPFHGSIKLFQLLKQLSQSVQSLSCVQLFLTPLTAARQATLSITNSQSLLIFMSIQSVMPSNHLILCHPLLLLRSILPSIRVFSNKSALCIR